MRTFFFCTCSERSEKELDDFIQSFKSFARELGAAGAQAKVNTGAVSGAVKLEIQTLDGNIVLQQGRMDLRMFILSIS